MELGTIDGYGRASVTLTVALDAGLLNPPPAGPLQLDAGARAFGTLDAGLVSNSTPAAVLAQGNVADASLLASTPDANTTDPYIQEEAAKLSYDPQQIFNFLQSDIGYNSYLGSVRGARGTLWSSAGNALDTASLGVALMRASGIPAQYVSGTLSQAKAQQLILSMFPATYQTVGYIAPGTQLSDPAHDPQLLAEAESHDWFQFDAGAGMTNADPLMVGATIGQTFTATTGTFDVVADNLRAKTEVSLTAEIYNQATAAFGLNPLQDTVVLDATFNDVDLVGVPLSIGNFVAGQGIGAGISATTFTYSPYVRLSDGATPDADTIIRGTDYQETYTNFPLGSEILTGLFLNVSSLAPTADGSIQTTSVRKTLFDRIGVAARNSGSPVSISTGSTPQAAFTSLDLVTLQVSAASQSVGPVEALAGLVGQLSSQDTQLASNLNQSNTADLTEGIHYLNNVTRDNVIESSSLLGATFLADSDQYTSATAGQLLTRVYFDTPRIVAVSSALTVDATTQQGELAYNMDILQDSPRVLAAPGQAAQIVPTYHFMHGFADSALEGLVLNPGQGAAAGQSSSALASLFAALNAGVGTAAITRREPRLIERFGDPGRRQSAHRSRRREWTHGPGPDHAGAAER